jgi:cardiolipin synthase
MRRFVEGEIANSVQITRESHRSQQTLFNRVKWALAYFVVAIADYSISRRLNFGSERQES